MKQPLQQAFGERSQIAVQLLQEPDERLEHTTKVIKHRCLPELIFISKNGYMPLGSQLHGILAMIAMNMRLDSGSLESLNSMIKSGMSLANNNRMSLELLSSRVNSRKACTLQTNGATNLKSVRPVMEKLAQSLMLYQQAESPILQDESRWAPPQPVGDKMPADRAAFDPCSVFGVDEKWAFKFHRKLMQLLKARNRSAGSAGEDIGRFIHSVVFTWERANTTSHDDDTAVFVVAELTGRSCQLVKLKPLQNVDFNAYEFTWPITFKTSIETIVQFRAGLHTENKIKPKVHVSLFDIGITCESGTIVIKLRNEQPAFSILYRKPREARPANAIEDGDEEDNGSESDLDQDIDRELELHEQALSLHFNQMKSARFTSVLLVIKYIIYI